MFKRNEGILDRIVRVALGMLLLPAGLLWWLIELPGSLFGLLAAGLGVLGLLTGLTGVSILYIPFGISTLEKEKEFIAKFMSMATSFCQRFASRRHSGAGQMCGSCLPVMGKTEKQEG